MVQNVLLQLDLVFDVQVVVAGEAFEFEDGVDGCEALGLEQTEVLVLVFRPLSESLDVESEEEPVGDPRVD